VVADNAENVQNSIKEINLKNFGCFAHTLNLIAKNAIPLPEVDRLISKLKTIVNHFKRSTTATEKLNKYQVQVVVAKPKKLLIDVPTRWNSTFYMCERALLLREAVTTTLALLESSSSSSLEPISADDWKLCEDLCTVFKPLEEVTRQISGERYLTGSFVIVFNRTLTNIYENKIPNDPTLHQSLLTKLTQHNMLDDKYIRIGRYRQISVLTHL
jgi:hypothetical protein